MWPFRRGLGGSDFTGKMGGGSIILACLIQQVMSSMAISFSALRWYVHKRRLCNALCSGYLTRDARIRSEVFAGWAAQNDE